MRKLLLVIPVLALVCCGCSNSNDRGSNSQESSADWAITTKVKAAIMSDSSLSASAHLVSVSTDNGVVTLTGNVPYPADAERIVRITKKVDGVKRVNDQMTVGS